MTIQTIDRGIAHNACELAEVLSQFLATIRAAEGPECSTTLAEVYFENPSCARLALQQERLSDGSHVYNIVL